MQSDLVVTVFGLIFFVSVGVTLIFVALLILGVFKANNQIKKKDSSGDIWDQSSHFPDKPTRGNLPKPLGRDRRELSLTIVNPAYSWATHKITTDGSSKLVPFPIFSSWVLFEESNKKALHTIQQEFIERFEEDIAGLMLYAGSEIAIDFLWPLRKKLDTIQTSVLLYNQFNPSQFPSNAHKFVYFDTSFNTGRTLEAGLNRLLKEMPKPEKLIFVFFNDLVPPSIRGEPWKVIGAELKILFLSSGFVRDYWRDQPQVADSVLTVWDALYGRLDWNNNRVEEAIEHLGDVLKDQAT